MDEIEIFENKNIKTSTALKYTDDYKQQVFEIWYANGKIGAPDLMNLIPIPATNFGKKPNIVTLTTWIRTFEERANNLDIEVRQEVDKNLVAVKVEMLKRHMNISREMQDLALDYLREHQDDLTSSTAVRLLVAMVELERQSASIPAMLDKMSKKTDEELLAEVKRLVEEAPVEFETIEDANE